MTVCIQEQGCRMFTCAPLCRAISILSRPFQAEGRSPFRFSIQRTQWLACSNPARHLWAHHSPPVLCSCSTAPRMELSQLPFWPWDPHYPNRSHLTAGQWCLIAKYQLQRNKGKQCEIESKPTNLMLSMGSSVHLTAEHTQRFPENHSIFWVGREL